uniref:Exo-alpha-sialidase n=1 Tax=candidate division WOR-3 bacterium TaxID=2052148 RepID=A0A7V5Y0K0_UNCW3
MKKLIFLLVILLTLLYADWVKVAIGPFDDYVSAITIAKGRNDDTNRIYVATWRSLYELTYRNNRWDILNMGTTSGWGVWAGDGRNDGRIRVYATFTVTGPQYGGVYEYTWTGSNWQREAVATFPSSPHSSAGHAVAIGKARNDGINRIYSTDGNNQRLFESTWDGQRWNTTQIFDSAGVNMIIAPARNDGINRIYFVGQGTTIKELSWDGQRWLYQLVDPTERTYFGIACGYGRNDSILRLYSGLGSYPNYGLYEFTWNGSQWEKIRAKGFPGLPRCVNLGDGRNEGLTRIYMGATGRQVAMEYWYVNNQWDSLVIDSIGSNSYLCVFVGDGRNDGINRVYFGSSDRYLYEFSYLPSGIKENNNNLVIKKDKRLINPLGQIILNPKNKKGVYFLYEKGKLKKFIKF